MKVRRRTLIAGAASLALTPALATAATTAAVPTQTELFIAAVEAYMANPSPELAAVFWGMLRDTPKHEINVHWFKAMSKLSKAGLGREAGFRSKQGLENLGRLSVAMEAAHWYEAKVGLRTCGYGPYVEPNPNYGVHPRDAVPAHLRHMSNLEEWQTYFDNLPQEKKDKLYQESKQEFVEPQTYLDETDYTRAGKISQMVLYFRRYHEKRALSIVEEGA